MTEELLAIATAIAQQAVGAEQIDVMVGRGRSTSIKVFEGEVESFTSAQTAGLGIRVIRDGRVGFASAGSLDPDVVSAVLADARDNVAFSAPDEFVGLAEPDGVAAVEHNHWNDALDAMSAEEKIDRAIELEALTRGRDSRITSIRTSAWSDGAGEVAYAASNGISRVDRGNSCSVGVQPLAVEDGETQIGYGGDAARRAEDLDIDRVASEAADRATRLLGAVKPPSARLTIVLEPKLAASLLGVVSGMLDGESVLKGRSPFADRVGEVVASPLLTMVDDPTQFESLAADSWDGEGLACRPTTLIRDGVLGGFVHNAYTARRSGTASTGSALRGSRSLPGVGARALVITPGRKSQEELIADIDLGLFVGSFAGMHSGINPVSGDFSVGADGLMIRNGALAEPVREITIASSIQRLLQDIAAIGADAEWLTSGDYMATMTIDDVSMSGV